MLKHTFLVFSFLRYTFCKPLKLLIRKERIVMENILIDKLESLFNVGVGNKFDYVGLYVSSEGSYVIDRTDGISYTDYFSADSKFEAIEILFEKIEEMIDEVRERTTQRHNELKEDFSYDYEKSDKEHREELDKIAINALYGVQSQSLKNYFNRNELEAAEYLHNKLVENYNLHQIPHIGFND